MNKLNLDNDFCLVISDLGKSGFVFTEMSVPESDETSVLVDLIAGQYEHVVQVVTINPGDGISRDISEDISRTWWNAIKHDITDYHTEVPEFIKLHHPDDLEAWLDEVAAEYEMAGPHYAETEGLTVRDVI